jgi:putative transposase
VLKLKAYKFRIYPTKAQITRLELILNLCRELYNAALQERRDAYRMCAKSLNYYDQANQLPALKEVRPDLNEVYSQVLQDVLRRVHKAFDGFFRRIKAGVADGKAGYPRFQGYGRYTSFTYPGSGWSLHNHKLTLSKIGQPIKVKLHRAVSGKVKTCTIKRESADKWFVIFTVEYEFEQSSEHHAGPAVGCDVGLEHFANLSNGEQIENPRYYRLAEKQLVRLQRRYSKLKALSPNDHHKRRALRALQNCHRHIRNCRNDFLHKVSISLAHSYSLIVVEHLKVQNLMARPKPKVDTEQAGHYLPNGASAKSGLTKSIAEASWRSFITILKHKVEYTGARVVEVNPRGTSQTCPECGALRPKELSERWHSCPCGASMHRDVAAARVILGRGLASIGSQSVDAPPFTAGE